MRSCNTDRKRRRRMLERKIVLCVLCAQYLQEETAHLFKGMDVRPRLQLQTIWFHSNQFGCQVQATDLAIDTSQVVAAQTECPF